MMERSCSTVLHGDITGGDHGVITHSQCVEIGSLCVSARHPRGAVRVRWENAGKGQKRALQVERGILPPAPHDNNSFVVSERR